MFNEFCKGYTYGWAARSGDYRTKEALDSMKRLKEDGCDWICIAFYAVQDTFASTQIYYEYGETPTDLDIITAIKNAKELGLKVCLKPVVNSKDTVWRAWIDFPIDEYWEKWFESYTKFLLHYADIAQEYECEMFCTGCEMNSMDKKADFCRSMIKEVRKHYNGVVMHNVNHDTEFDAVWLDEVDVIGISAYYALTTKDDTSIEKMKEVWKSKEEVFEKVHNLYKKPIVFAEIGVRSEKYCTNYPWDSLERDEYPVAEDEQADFYESCMQTYWAQPWFKGYFWWDWRAITYTEDKAHEDKDFCIYGKKAEQVMKTWYTTK